MVYEQVLVRVDSMMTVVIYIGGLGDKASALTRGEIGSADNR